jgi:hypothetical protein
MRHRILLVAALALVSACGGGDDPTSPNDSFAGTYTLRTINGSNLPYTVVQVGADKLEITDDAITLNDGGTWTESGHYRETENGVVTTTSIVDAGTYTRTGTAITLASPTTGTVSGTVSGGTLTVSLEGLSAVYRK